MATLLDSTILNGSIQKVVEAPNGYIINGHYYEKATMSPHPLDLYPTYGDNACLSMDKMLVNRHSNDGLWGKSHGHMIVRDNYNPEVFYTWTIGTRANYQYFFKMRETTNNQVEVMQYANFGAAPTSYPMAMQYAGQDKNYVYYHFCTGNQGLSYFGRINKQTLAIDFPRANDTYSVPTNFKETDQYIFWGYQKFAGGTYMFRYNKATNVNDTVTCLPLSSNVTYRLYVSRLCNPVQLSTSSDYTYALHHDYASNKYYITKYVLDYSKADPTQVVTEAPCATTWGNGFTEIKVLPSSTNFQYELFTSKASNGNMYLHIDVSNLPGKNDTTQIPDMGIYTFLIDPLTRDLTFKGFLNPSTSLYRGFLGIKEHSFLIGVTDQSMFFMQFDEALEKFVLKETITNQPYFIAADSSENIWIVNGATEVEMISPLVPKDIIVKLETNSYKYVGTPINTYVTIEAKNYSGIDIESNIDLTLKGNAVFTSNSTIHTLETTSVSGPKMVPITVNGPGGFSVYPKLVL